jgi:hypothetical protein
MATGGLGASIFSVDHPSVPSSQTHEETATQCPSGCPHVLLRVPKKERKVGRGFFRPLLFPLGKRIIIILFLILITLYKTKNVGLDQRKMLDTCWLSPAVSMESTTDNGKCRTCLRNAAAAAGIGKVGTHSMRHTYRSWLDAVGTAITVQQKLMRHSDIQTTLNIYGDVVTDEMRQAGSKVVGLAIDSRVIPTSTTH